MRIKFSILAGIGLVFSLSAVLHSPTLLATSSDKSNPGDKYVTNAAAADIKPGVGSKHIGPEEKPLNKKETISRGKMLYSNHCHACHESNVHIRAHRKVKKKTDIYYWVNRWSAHLKLGWNSTDRDQVVEYLNKAYYKFK